MEQQKRQNTRWIVYVKPIKQLKKFGNIHYISKRSKYIYRREVQVSVMERYDIPLVRKWSHHCIKELHYGFHTDSSRITRGNRKRKNRETAELNQKKPCALMRTLTFRGRFQINGWEFQSAATSKEECR